MLLYSKSTLQLCSSRRLSANFKTVKFSFLHPFGRRGFPFRPSIVQASSVRTTRNFLLDIPLCREPSNCSSLHLFGRLSNTAGHLSMFEKENDFFPKHTYGKTAATVRMMWCSRPDAILYKASHAEEVQPSGRQTPWSRRLDLVMEIACSKSATVWMLG
jgi:hypothetical protein